MTAKHMAAMMGTKGADAKTQQTIQTLTGGLAKMIQSGGQGTENDKNGNVPVLVFSVDNNAAEAQMRLNAKVLGGLGPGQEGVPGIGDQAFDEAGAMMMVRKGDKLISHHVFHLPVLGGSDQAFGKDAGRSFVGGNAQPNKDPRRMFIEVDKAQLGRKL